MKSAKDVGGEITAKLDRMAARLISASGTGDDIAGEVTKMIEARDSEHSAALAESQKRVAELEAEVESLKGGVNPRSMRMNNRSLRMK